MRVNILGEHKCEICLNDGIYLQSYQSIVAKKGEGKITLYPKWDYSHTTAKHVGQWLNKSCAEIRKLIKTGLIKEESYEPDL